MNNQEWFNNAWNWFIVDKKPLALLTEAPYTCKYRTDDGRKCAIGCSIAAEDYLPEIENLGGVSGVINSYKTYKSGLLYHLDKYFVDANPHFLSRLQQTHDTVARSNVYGGILNQKLARTALEVSLRNLASSYGLKIPTIKENAHT